tara:strand:- start:1637 stop:2296 length:660 start_codon:yes stop_codon:yes gene_type:complete
MKNLGLRLITSFILIPFSIFILLLGGIYLNFFSLVIFLIGIYEISKVFKNLKSRVLLLTILIFSLYALNFLANENFRSAYMLYFAILVCLGSDIGGFVFGKVIGGKKLIKISPNKTFSGVAGAYIFSFLFLFIFNTYFLKSINESINVSLIYGFNEIFLTIIFSTFAQVGDLTISYLKRIDKIKDTGKIFPGHGGLFDRIDSMMFVIILSYIFYLFLKI